MQRESVQVREREVEQRESARNEVRPFPSADQKNTTTEIEQQRVSSSLTHPVEQGEKGRGEESQRARSAVRT